MAVKALCIALASAASASLASESSALRHMGKEHSNVHLLHGCQSLSYLKHESCAVSMGKLQIASLRSGDSLMFHAFRDSAESTPHRLYVSIQADSTASLAGIEAFAANSDDFSRLLSLSWDDRALLANESMWWRAAGSLRQVVDVAQECSSSRTLDLSRVQAELQGDADGWPARRLRKLSLPVSTTLHEDTLEVLLGEDVSVSEGVMVVLRYTGGGLPVTLRLGVGVQEEELTVDRVLQAPSYTALTLNTPKGDAVPYNQYRYYSYDSAGKALGADLAVILTPSFGDADIYVTVDGQAPSKDHWQFQSSGFFVLEKVVLTAANTATWCSAGSNPGTVCPIRIAVFGYTPGSSTYQVTVSSFTGAAIPLANGVPIIDDVQPGQVNYYSLTGDSQGSPSFAFTMTALAGDPDLYISSNTGQGPAKGGPTPNNTNYCYAANTHSTPQDTIVISSGDPQDCYASGPFGTYYIGVQAKPIAGPAAYVLIGLEEGTASTLLDGQPTSGVIPAGTTDQYQLQVNPFPGGLAGRFKRMVEVAVLPLSGNPDLYITLSTTRGPPGPNNWDYRSNVAQGVDYIAMRDSDPQVVRSKCANWTVACTIYIGVYAAVPSVYIVAGTTGARPIALVDGAPIEAAVDAGYYLFFSFTTYSPGLATVISVDPLSGLTATYVGSGARNATLYPNGQDPSSWIWRSTSLSANVIVIEPTDPLLALACPTYPCTFTIGVRALGALGNSTFSILARTRSSAPSFLQPGIPILDVVSVKDYSRYRASFDRTLGYLEVVVSPVVGDPDLYMALDNRTVTNTNFQYSAAGSEGDADDIIVYPTDSAFKSSCGLGAQTGPCTASIAVYGFSEAAYFITASNGVRVLMDGETSTGKVGPNLYSYFTLTVYRSTPVTISVTPISGDPDLFVSVTNPRPTYGNATWTAAGDSVDQVVIDPANAFAAACFASLPCTLYIGVQGFTPSGQGMTMFRITGSSSGLQFLSDGVPVVADIQPGTMSYFLYQAPAGALTSGLEFTAEPLDAGMDLALFISNAINPGSQFPLFPSVVCLDPSCTSISVSNAVWSSDSDDREEIRIDTSDPRVNPAQPMYVVGVYSQSGGGALVEGSLFQSIKPLVPSLPVQESLPTGAYSFYSLSLTQPGVDVLFTVTPITGDPDLYLSLNASNRAPTRGNSDRSATDFDVEQIIVTWAELLQCQAILGDPACAPGGAGGSACVCYVYASVLAYTNATFTIVASVNNNGTRPVRLLDGIPQAGAAVQGRWAYYYVDVALPAGSAYSFSLTVKEGDADLYVATDGQGPPTQQRWQYSSSAFDGDELIDVQPGTPGYLPAGRVWVGVFAYDGNIAFTLTYMSAISVTKLEDGVQQSGVLRGGTWSYYSYGWTNPRRDTVTLATTSLSGNPDLYAAVWPVLSPRFRPSLTVYTWASNAAGPDSLVIAPNDPSACARACTLIVGVYCAGTGGCRFGMTASNSGSGRGSLVQLTDGQPQGGVVNAGSYTYFLFNAGSPGRNLIFRVTPTGGGDAQLVVTNRYTPGTSDPSTLPINAPGSFIWSSARGTGTGATGTGWVNVSSSDPRTSPTLLQYVIGVYGVSGGPSPSPRPSGQQPVQQVSFTITASSSLIPILLQSGVPSVNNFVSRAANVLYAVDVQDTSQDLTVAAVVGEGAVTMALMSATRAGNTLPSCTTAANCGAATWTSIVAGAPTSLVRVVSFSPCTGPYVVNPATCDVSKDWKAGRYYIAVFGIQDTQFSITAFTGASYLTLVQGQPQLGVLARTASALPAQYAFRTGQDIRLPDVRFSFDQANSTLSFYMRSCVDRQCTAGDAQPGPSNYEFSGTVRAQTSVDFFITKYMSGAYCAAPAGQQCIYFLAVFLSPGFRPGCAGDPTGARCPPVTFMLEAAAQSGTYPNIIQQSSIANRVYSMNGNVPAGSSALYELYLSPTPPIDVTLDLQACTNGWVSLYVCNPSPQAGSGAVPCPDPFSPSSSANTASGSTAPGGAGKVPGTLRLLDRGVQTSNYFLSVAADTTAGGPAFGQGNWMYQLSMSSGTAYYLSSSTPGAPAPVVTASPTGDGTSFSLSWPPALVLNQAGAVIGPAKGVTYYVYPAVGAFIPPGNPLGVVDTTACGIFLWAGAQPEDVIPTATARDVTTVTLSGLTPGSAYQFAVIAECDRTCWRASTPAAFAAGEQEEEEEEEEEGAEGSRWPETGVFTVGQAPGYVTQRVVYPVVGGNTGNPGGAAGAITLPPGAIAGIVITSLVVLSAAGGVLWYRRGGSFDRVYQYSALDIGGGGGGGAGAGRGAAEVSEWGMSGGPGSGSTRVANPLVRAGPGLLSKLRASFTPATTSASTGAGGLADSNYSTLEDRVEQYM